MLFAPYERYQYARAPLVEVICQLRFPTILSIGAKEPAEFQEAIRKDFPQYAARQEQLPPKVVKKGNATALEPQKPITNYNFISEDGRWKLNLTQGFIALSTLSYTRWEDFATRLDRPLAQFIQLYQPAFFERIGLRYVNAVSRQRLGLEGELWDDLIRSQYIGILGEPDVEESEIAKCSLDVETPLGASGMTPRAPSSAAARPTRRSSSFWTATSPPRASITPTRCPKSWSGCTGSPSACSRAPSPRSFTRPWGPPLWPSKSHRPPVPRRAA